MKTVSHCQYTGSSIVAHCEEERGIKRQVHLHDTRAGVAFPTGSSPGYFVILGRQVERMPTGKHKLLFLSEGEDIMHETLFEKLTDDCTKYKCKTLYAHLIRTDRRGGVGGYDDLWRYLRNRRLQINLVPAPAADDPEYGKALVREFIKDGALDVPQHQSTPTILRSQLREMTPEADDSKLYAFSALRYVIAGFVKFNAVTPYRVESRKDPRVNPRGWT